MKYRRLGKTKIDVSEVGFGAWAIGGTWGNVDDDISKKALEKAIDCGINFIDTADVYGDGRSERIVSQIIKEYGDKVHVATKAGRRLNPHTAAGYNYENLKDFIKRSLDNLGLKEIELLQLHCPPTETYYNPQTFDAMDKLVEEGYVLNYGVSVEKVEEAIKALEFPNVSTIQIIFNMFRQRPSDLLFSLAEQKNVGIISRVPLASGMLTGKFSGNEKFEDDDHRKFNRNGEAFDRGETFAGVDFHKGIEATNELKQILPDGWKMTNFALKWILMHSAVSTVITGAKTPDQIEINSKSSDLADIPPDVMRKVEEIYNRMVKPMVHQYW